MPTKPSYLAYIVSAAIALAIGAVAFFAVRPSAKGAAATFGMHGVAAASAPSADAPTIQFVKDPQPAPDFQLPGVDGKPVSVSASRGKVTVVNFWATWCGPCKVEIPNLVALQSKYGAQLQVIGIGNDDVPADDVKKFAARMNMNYPVAITTPEVEKKFGGIAALPTSFLIDPQGRVVQKHVGVFSADKFELEVRALAGLPVDAKIETFEDTGQVFLANTDRATDLPDVDMSRLTPEQKKAALRQMNQDDCPCGCGLTIAQCRVNDETCDVSLKAAADIVKQVAKGGPSQGGHPPSPAVSQGVSGAPPTSVTKAAN